jgi:hypothetical protein
MQREETTKPMVGRKIAKKVVELGKKIVDVFSDPDGEFKNLKRAGTVDDLLGRKQVAVVPGDGTMVIMATKGSAATKPGWLQVKIQNLGGNGVDLLVMPQALVLQMKHAVAKVVPSRVVPSSSVDRACRGDSRFQIWPRN